MKFKFENDNGIYTATILRGKGGDSSLIRAVTSSSRWRAFKSFFNLRYLYRAIMWK